MFLGIPRIFNLLLKLILNTSISRVEPDIKYLFHYFILTTYDTESTRFHACRNDDNANVSLSNHVQFYASHSGLLYRRVVILHGHVIHRTARTMYKWVAKSLIHRIPSYRFRIASGLPPSTILYIWQCHGQAFMPVPLS